MSVCLFVPKDLANRWTDRILLNKVASHRSLKVYNYFGGGYHHPPKKITINVTFKVPLEASSGVSASSLCIKMKL